MNKMFGLKFNIRGFRVCDTRKGLTVNVSQDEFNKRSIWEVRTILNDYVLRKHGDFTVHNVETCLPDERFEFLDLSTQGTELVEKIKCEQTWVGKTVGTDERKIVKEIFTLKERSLQKVIDDKDESLRKEYPEYHFIKSNLRFLNSTEFFTGNGKRRRIQVGDRIEIFAGHVWTILKEDYDWNMRKGQNAHIFVDEVVKPYTTDRHGEFKNDLEEVMQYYDDNEELMKHYKKFLESVKGCFSDTSFKGFDGTFLKGEYVVTGKEISHIPQKPWSITAKKVDSDIEVTFTFGDSERGSNYYNKTKIRFLD